MSDEVSSRGHQNLSPPPGPEPGSNPVQEALGVLLEMRRSDPATIRDLADPFRREWLAESAAGQDLKVSKETLRLMDILCWAREDPAVLLSVTELVTDLGQQLARLMTLAIYLHELSGVNLDLLEKSYAVACGVNTEPRRN
jgi:hypothetical protein